MRFSIDVAEDVPNALVGDPLRLSQVLFNLGDNAVKFSESGDTVSLTITLEERNDKDSLLQFSVQDTGIGITPEQKRKLFQSFSQADSSTTRKYGGSGLGLIISKKIIHMMGGEIWFESELDIGSTFSFVVRFENVQDQSSSVETDRGDNNKDQYHSMRKLRGAKILVVDDNEFNQEIVFEYLTSNGMTVKTASDGQEALEMLDEEEFDGVLMDCQMPVMDGIEATRKIREQEKFKELPVIALTANVMTCDLEMAVDAGMNDYIAKPFDPETMFATIAKWIN